MVIYCHGLDYHLCVEDSNLYLQPRLFSTPDPFSQLPPHTDTRVLDKTHLFPKTSCFSCDTYISEWYHHPPNHPSRNVGVIFLRCVSLSVYLCNELASDLIMPLECLKPLKITHCLQDRIQMSFAQWGLLCSNLLSHHSALLTLPFT